jgi:hypothetical protein
VVYQSKAKKDKDIERFNKISIPENPFEGKHCI